MAKKVTLLSLALCVVLSMLADRSYSRARPPQTLTEQQRWMQEQQRKLEQLHLKTEQERLKNQEKGKAAQKEAQKIVDKYSDEAWQEILGATPEQWKVMKPRMDRIRSLDGSPGIRVSIYGFGGSGGSTSGNAGHGAGGAAGTGTGSGLTSGGAGAGPGGSPDGGGAASGGGGYRFNVGGTGPVKKQVGDVSLGWQWRRPSLNKKPNQLSEREKTCEQLLDVLEAKNPDPEQVRRGVEALRKAREQLQAEWREARRQLREVVTPEQEAKLILMGYLD